MYIAVMIKLAGFLPCWEFRRCCGTMEEKSILETTAPCSREIVR